MDDLPEYKRLTIESYDKHASAFAEKFKGLLELHRRDEFGRFMALLGPNKDILDVGCGGGDHAKYFLDLGYRVTGIDISEKMVALSREKGIDARVMDLEAMSFPHQSFDGIWAVTSLLHVPKKRMPMVVDKLHAVLRDNGFLYVCMKEGETEGLVRDENDPATQRYFSFYEDFELEQLFREKFDILPYRDVRMPVKKTVFLQLFFRKRPVYSSV